MATPSHVKIDGKWVEFDFCDERIDAYDDERFPIFKNRVYVGQGAEFKYGGVKNHFDTPLHCWKFGKGMD